MSDEQRKAVEAIAVAFGWDRMSLGDLRLNLWSLFHYYVTRLPT